MAQETEGSDVTDLWTGLSVNASEFLPALLTKNLESNDLTKVEMHQTMGRIVLTTASVKKVGTILLRESPVLVWKNDDWVEFLAKFESLTDEDRYGVLDMYHPSLDTKQMQELLPTALDLASRSTISTLDTAIIHKLLAIVYTNAHEYYNDGETSSEVPSQHQQHTALFLYGSKVAHSCHPNATYKISNGNLEYIAVRPIKEGEAVSISYLGLVYETPTHVRRKKLYRSRGFLCQCSRCMGLDYARQIHCPNNKTNHCSTFIICTTNDGTEPPIWTCKTCGQLDRNTNDMVSAHEREVKQAFLANYSVVSQKLGPLHYHALSVMKRSSGRENTIESIRVTLSLILACECIAAGCDGVDCSIEKAAKHEPVYEKVKVVFSVSLDLIKYSKELPPCAIQILKKYLPLIAIWLGDCHNDVKEISQKVASAPL